jgi:O-antigen/teichoic acid export membrane protein
VSGPEIEAEGSAVRLAGWSRKMSLSLTDQFTLAGTNFVVQLLLARWLGAASYGDFVVAYAIMLILAGMHTGLLVDPMSVLGPRHTGSQRAAYYVGVVRLHLGLAGLLAVMALSATVLLNRVGHSTAGWALPLCLPLVLTHWLCRRLAYVIDTPKLALGQSLVYAAVVLLGLAALRATDALSGFSALALIGLGAGAASVLGFGRLAMLRIQGSGDVPRSGSSTVSDHWRLGKWGVAESLLQAGGATVYPLLVALFGGLHEAGAFRAMQVLFLPLGHAGSALSQVLLPWLSRHRLERGETALARAGMTLLVLTCAVALGYVAVIAPLGRPLVRVLYGQAEYAAWLWMIPFVGAAALLNGMFNALSVILRAAERPDRIFRAQAVRSAVTLSLGILLAVGLGVEGLVIGLVASTLAGTLLLGWFFRRYAGNRQRCDAS